MAITNMGFLLAFWTKQICPFDVFFYTKVLKFLPAKQIPRILLSMESWKHPGGIFVKELICCSVFMQFCHN
jgi:hypothetical protein